MRTTLDIADDVLFAAKDLARRQGTTAGQVISDLARRSLTRSTVVAPEFEDEFFGFRPLPADGVIVTNEIINALRDGDILTPAKHQ